MKRHSLYILSIVAAALSAASCNQEELGTKANGNAISFEITTDEPATKATLYNSESEFAAANQVFGIYAWDEEDTQFYDNVTVAKTGGHWRPGNASDYQGKWKENASYTFVAVYPKPSNPLGSVGLTALDVCSTPADVTFSYKVPSATMSTADKDLMLAYYSGTGDNGVAPLTFTHPLTCVNFKAGTLTGISTINSITISSVYETGDCTVRPTTFGTGNRQGFSYEAVGSSHTSLWTPSGSTSVTGTSTITASNLSTSTWAYNFLLIPQNTATKAALLKINVTTDGGHTLDLNAKIDTDNWRAGFTNTYKISYSAGDELVLDPVHVTPWDVDPEQELSMGLIKYEIEAEAVSSSVDYLGGDIQIKVKSNSTVDGGSSFRNEPWTLEYSIDGINWSATKPEMFESAVSGNGSTAWTNVDIPIAAQTVVEDAWSENGNGATHTASLQARAEITTRQDLSLVDAKFPRNVITRGTSNCYIIYQAGKYMFPMAYGNSIVDGALNSSSYSTTATGEMLNPLQGLDANGNAIDISSASIVSLCGGSASDYYADLLWQDERDVISAVGENTDSFGLGNGFVTFDVSLEYIHECNALIALRKKVGSEKASTDPIVWSWHIWVKDIPITTATSNYTGIIYEDRVVTEPYTCMTTPLGFCDGGRTYYSTMYPARSYYVRAVQTNGANRASDAILINQTENSVPQYASYCTAPYWQWGRKDPLIASCGDRTKTGSAALKTVWDINGNVLPPMATVAGPMAPAFSVGHPDKYITKAISGNMDWSPKKYHNLWSMTKGDFCDHSFSYTVVKTIYDPCPYGFHIPNFAGLYDIAGYLISWTSGNSWTNGTDTTPGYGHLAAINVDIPALGYRFLEDGSVKFFGESANYWAAGISENSVYSYQDLGQILYFNAEDCYTTFAEFGQKRSNASSVLPFTD